MIEPTDHPSSGDPSLTPRSSAQQPPRPSKAGPSHSSPAVGTTGPRERFDWRGFLERYGALVAFLLLFAFNAVWSDPGFQTRMNSRRPPDAPLFEYVAERNTFLQPENLRNILRQNAFVGLIAIGMTFVIILGGIDLSVGSMVALVGGVTIWTLNGLMEQGQSEAAAVALAVLAGLLLGPALGLVNGLFVTKGRIAPFIATLGAMAIYRSVALSMANSGEFRSQSREVFPEIASWGLPLPGVKGGNGEWIEVPTPVLVFFAVAIVAHLLLFWTRYGRYVIAIGCNERAAIYSAINVDRVQWLTYTLMGACTAFAAVLLASRQNSIASGSTGLFYELDAIAAVVIGGTRMQGGSGRILGTVLGVFILGIINNMLNQFRVDPELHQLVKGCVIIGAVLIQRKPRL